jgi:hypothetical protein
VNLLPLMKPTREAVSGVVISALVLVLIGTGSAVAEAASPAAATEMSATIYNPGNDDYVGFRIVVGRDGQAAAVDGAGRASRLLQPDIIDRFFADLESAAPIAKRVDAGCTPNNGLQTTTIDLNNAVVISWGTRRWSGLTCTSDARAIKLLSDAIAIQRSLYVQVYRERLMARFSGNGGSYSGGAYSPQGGYVVTGVSSGSGGGYGNSGLNLGSLSMGGLGSGLTGTSPFNGSLSGSLPTTGLPSGSISGGLPGASLPGSSSSGSLPSGSPYGGGPFSGGPYGHP